MTEFDDDKDSCDSFVVTINDKGELEEAKTVYLSKKDFDKLQNGLIKLKEKYPKISKECFPN